MIKLSIIIPIYKVEEYIIECIESVCCQLVESVEVILVNDGTPDRSMVIAKEYINEKYSQYLKQFIFIDQKNQGLSGARNTGLSVSTGKYITFLDSDDKLQENYFNKILNIILINDVDVIQFSALRFDNDGNYSSFLKKSVAAGFCEMNEENLVLIFEDSSWFIWLRVYKKELFHSIYLLKIIFTFKTRIIYCDKSKYSPGAYHPFLPFFSMQNPSTACHSSL